jgi:polyhydroxyalkanoate synthesis regulator phasin
MTMTHPTDEDLILHYYGEGGAEAEAQVTSHLRACDACQSAWTALRQTMEMVDVAEVPEPSPAFERVMWARVQPALAKPDRRSWWSLRALVPISALAALIVVAFAAGRMWPHAGAPATTTATPALTAAQLHTLRERVLLSALGDHFAQTQTLLVELMNAPDTDRAAFEFARMSADDLVSSGRLYRQTAQQNGDVRLAQMLEELESVLVDVARSPEHVDQKDMQSLRARIDHGNLLFKVRAVTNEVQRRQKTLADAE